ncbi:MAG: sigma-70 family RNA polymerase sigma factor [Planctomycetota bacterium]|nr:sigma-70 family RNA polymerase sigma factor [Planctomycetota bacterium]
MNPLTTRFVSRLRDRDEAAWFELWDVFGPVIRSQLHRWARGAVGQETVRDLTQETLAALSTSIDRFDPERGVRFSTWLLSIAKHVLGDELDRRNALKRGGGRRPLSLEESFMSEWRGARPDEIYERNIFHAKVYASIRSTEAASEFLQFQVFRLKLIEGVSGQDIAKRLGISEPTVSRHMKRVRARLREELKTMITTYSFTEDEITEADKAGLSGDDALFDEAICDIWNTQISLVNQDEQRSMRF